MTAVRDMEDQEPPVNTGDPWPEADEARRRVLKIQTKLHQWASDDPDRRFDDLFNLVYDPTSSRLGASARILCGK